MSFKLRYPVGDSEFLFPWSIVCARTSRKIVWNFLCPDTGVPTSYSQCPSDVS